MRPSVDMGLRAQLADNLVTDELMDITDKLFTIALDFGDTPDAMSQEIVDLIMDVLWFLREQLDIRSPLINTSVILSAASNLRGRHTTLTSIV